MRILVTGGAGFIGKALVGRLLGEGHHVSILDDFSRGEPIGSVGNLKVLDGDVRNFDDVFGAVWKSDEVIHLAYINGTKTFYEKPDEVLDVAVHGIVNVLRACTHHKVKRFMLMSSSEVCRADIGSMNESIPLVIPDPFNPRYSYSAGKIISEMMAIHHKGFDWLTIIRPFNIYGPHMTPGHVIPDFKMHLDRIKTYPHKNDVYIFNILGNGNETRSFCYIDDFIDGVMLVREKGQHKGIYNIGTSEEISIRNLAQEMGNILGIKLAVQDGNQLREGSIARRKPDIAKMQVLGYEPKVSLNEGLRRVLCQ